MAYTISGSAQSAKPPKGQKFTPPVFGHWQVGEVVIIDGDSIRSAFLPDPKEDNLTLLPPGIHVSFLPDYDSKARENIMVMTLLPPFPPISCEYVATGAFCVGEGNSRRPNPEQKSFGREFTLSVYNTDLDMYKAFGATKNDVWYQIWTNGKGWLGHFYVSKDRQTMWTDVNPNEPMIVNPDSSRKESKPGDLVFQVYHRLPEGRYR